MSDAEKLDPTSSMIAEIERVPDFRDYYSNNVNLESTAWDLKFTFGHIDRASVSPLVVKNDCSVTVPWTGAKLALFWLRLHVELAESEFESKIPIRKDLLPAELPEKLSDQVESNPVKAKKFRELYNRIRAEFLESI